MNKDHKHTTTQKRSRHFVKAFVLIGILLLSHLPGYSQQSSSDSTAKKVSKDTTTSIIIADTTAHISKELEEIRKRKGTNFKHKDDLEQDTLKQKIVETIDQNMDVIKPKLITDTIPVQPVEKKKLISDKPLNTEAIPSAPTQLVNTIDAGGGSSTPIVKDSTATTNNKYNANLQSQMNTQLNALFTTSLLHDSMVAENNKDFLFNNITITNVSNAKLSLLVTIVIPNGWQTVSDKVITVNLDPNGSTVIPMRVAPFNSNTAGWKQVRIEYRNTVTGESRNDFFSVREKEFTKFKARLPNPNLVLPGYQKLISIPIYVKNLGNTPATYKINYQNDFFHLDGQSSVDLAGGADTSLNVTLVVNENEWTMLKKEDVKIVVSNNGDAYNLMQNISRVGYILKDHPSAYADMPLQLEAGTISQGQTAVQYYGALYGSVDIDSKDKVAIALRTNTISKTQTIDNGLARLDYTGEHIQASVGNIMEMTDFLMDGYGAKAGYSWGKNNNNKIVLYGEIKSRTGNSNVFGTNMQFGLKDKIKLITSISSDLDNLNKLNSTIARETIDMKLSEKLRLDLIGGVSLEQTGVQLVDNSSSSQSGSTVGYNLQFTDKHLSVLSSALYNSDAFAGVYKGQRLQSHDVRFAVGKLFIGGYYDYSYKAQSTYVDSVLMKNVFGLSSENYGGRMGYSMKAGNIIVSAGQQNQLQAGADNNFELVFRYLNLNTTLNFTRHINLNLNSYTGNSSAASQNVNNVFVSSSMGSLNIYNSGIAFRYDQGPFYYSDFSTYIQNPQNTERMLVSPFVDFQLFKDQLSLRAQYNYTETVPATGATSNFMMNISYANPLKGYDFHLTGTLPIQGQENSAYLNASVRMRLNAPCIALRKYYRVRIVLFKDMNSNGKRDDDEDPIAGQMISVNGNLFVSDDNGIITYENVEKGVFKGDFGYTSKIRGWAPRDGAMQTFNARGNATFYVPYRKCRVLSGKLNVVNDENSNIKFDPSKIKVTAVSDDNVSYSTLTDENGEFFFNLPTGHYTVSLSTVAFDEHFRPTQFSQQADMQNNETMTLYFEIRQRKRQINISH
jgi:hypothetical protein